MAVRQTLSTSSDGIRAITESEGLRLKAYQDGAGVWTIGYGHTATAREGMEIGPSEAERLLRLDLREAEDVVNRRVEVDLKQNQFDALVSLVYNIGGGAFSNSALLRLLNSGDYVGAAEQLPRWNKITVAGKKVADRGLTKRRARERAMFERGMEIPIILEERKPMILDEFARAALGVLARKVPEVGEIYAKSDAGRKNVEGLAKILETAKEVSDAVSEQEAVQKIAASPQLQKDMSTQVRAEYYDIVTGTSDDSMDRAAARVSLGGPDLAKPLLRQAFGLLLAGLIGVFALMGWYAYKGVDVPGELMAVAISLVTMIGISWKTMIEYRFGSSDGSKRSGDAVREIATRGR